MCSRHIWPLFFRILSFPIITRPNLVLVKVTFSRLQSPENPILLSKLLLTHENTVNPSHGIGMHRLIHINLVNVKDTSFSLIRLM